MNDATNFWLLAGTAAPVIALANIVLLGDMVKLYLDLKSVHQGFPAKTNQEKLAKNGVRVAIWAAVVGYVNLIIQTIGITGALDFFEFGHTIVSGNIAYYFIVLGMIALMFGSALSSYARHAAEKLSPLKI